MRDCRPLLTHDVTAKQDGRVNLHVDADAAKPKQFFRFDRFVHNRNHHCLASTI